MYTPPINEILIFPTGDQNKHIKLPQQKDIRAGFFVTPEDLIDSKRTEEYFGWRYKNNILIEI